MTYGEKKLEQVKEQAKKNQEAYKAELEKLEKQKVNNNQNQ